ncbi:MAG: synthase subunit delta [Glaciihabitans sp.]|jgi:F-type H+-transporting ATPase subunit delta|nr:synthase subunit delta [Glaciihabitans sp.]MDQ1571464.1 F-type H+-transporting ATPase subunit delta [Actinomycetota bacterium]
MGSATREALATTVAVLAKQDKVSLEAGEQLLDASLLVAGSPQLRAALADDTAEAATKLGIVDAVFAAYTPVAKTVLDSLVVERWSSAADLVAGIEELGIRAIATSAPASLSIDDELLAFAAAVSSNAELELALGSKLGSVDTRVALVRNLLGGKASEHTVAIVAALIAQPRGRRVGELLRYGANLVADQAGAAIATITVAIPLSKARLERLEKALSAQYDKDIRINEILDARVLGGMRVQIGDEVIDGTISNRISDLRLQLAG